MSKKHNKKYSKKDILIREILKIYEVIYEYDRNDLIYCYHELKKNKTLSEIYYINKRLKEINESKIAYLNLL